MIFALTHARTQPLARQPAKLVIEIPAAPRYRKLRRSRKRTRPSNIRLVLHDAYIARVVTVRPQSIRRCTISRATQIPERPQTRPVARGSRQTW